MLSIINLRSLLRRNFGAGLSALLAGGGDVYGATAEIGELVVLFVFVLAQSFI
jgi:adenosylcobinamide-GDP ribazoletransferase